MSTDREIYNQLLAKRSSDLNQCIEDLKNLEGYAVCARETKHFMQSFIDSQRIELQNLLSSNKITNESFEVCHSVLRNILNSLDNLQEEALKKFYTRAGVTEFIKKDMADLVNLRSDLKEMQKDKLHATEDK